MTSYLRDSTAVLLLLSWGKLNTVTLFCNAVLHRKEADSRKKANFVRSTSDTDKRVAMLLHHNQVKNIRNQQSNFAMLQGIFSLNISVCTNDWRPLQFVLFAYNYIVPYNVMTKFRLATFFISYIDSKQILSSKISRRSLNWSNSTFSCLGE